MLNAEENEVASPDDFYNDVIKDQGTCDGLPTGSSCWMALTNHSECYVWNEDLKDGASAIWQGKCSVYRTDGDGTLTWYGAFGEGDERVKKKTGGMHRALRERQARRQMGCRIVVVFFKR